MDGKGENEKDYENENDGSERAPSRSFVVASEKYAA